MKKDRFIKNIILAVLFIIILWFGILPRLTGVSFDQYLKKTHAGNYEFAENEYATIIVGSEPEGIAAALACARTGLKTLLITEDSDLASYIGSSMISQMKPDEGLINGKKTILNEGVYKEIFGKLRVGFTTEEYLDSVNQLVKKQKSLTIKYDCTVQEVVKEGRNIKGIRVSIKDQEDYFIAATFIDATQNGELLDLCGVPFKTGAEDLNFPDAYMPLDFNFVISGVAWEELGRIQKTSDFALEFKDYLMRYERSYPRTKIVSPSFIKQSDNAFIITGLRQWGVDVNDPKDVQKAYEQALDEAYMLTAYMKSVFIPFENCTFKTAPDELYIPEYKHYEGRYTLTVADILNNKNFKNKIALVSNPIDAGKFVDQGFDYIVTDPNVYAIPLDCIIPINMDNVLMIGPKASYKSLASTSAGSIPTSITVGESAGLTGAYCFMNQKKPNDLLSLPDDAVFDFVSYLKRGGILMEEFSEKILIADSKEALESHWSYPYIVELAEFGLIAGGLDNNFRLESEASCDVMAILLKNAIVKIAPSAYTLNFDASLKAYENANPLTGESACAMILLANNKTFSTGKAYETAQDLGLIPKEVYGKIHKDQGVTMDVVYCLTIEASRSLTAK